MELAKQDTPTGEVEQMAALALAGVGAEAQGQALAHVFVKHLQDQANGLQRFMKDLFDLSLEGRKAFRTQVTHWLKEQRDFVKSHEGKADHEMLKKTFNSSQVRMSEAVSVSRAFDAGFNPVWTQEGGKWTAKVNRKSCGYHALVGFAREFLTAQAANGPTARRGRQAKDGVTKVEEYILRMKNDGTITDDDLVKIQEWLAAGAPAPQKAE